jgi:iron(III) transport system ATP-binding protein
MLTPHTHSPKANGCGPASPESQGSDSSKKTSGNHRQGLECRGLAKQFAGVPAVDGLNLSVPFGKVLALVGPSGCGKTTALRIIAGFERPERGTIHLGGRPVCGPGSIVPPEKRKIGMVFQEGALFPHLTVEQNVAYGLPKAGKHNGRVDEVLELVGLHGLRRRMPHELSGGQQQRVALGRALAPNPELLLLDEPFSNLDPKLREQVRRDFREIVRASHATTVFVTHDQEEALYLGDLISVINQGRVQQTGTPEQIFHSPATRFVAEFIGMVDFLPASWNGDRLSTELGSMEWPGEWPGSLPLRLPLRLSGESKPPQADEPKTEGSLEVMVRPDCLECYPAEDGQGVIVEREFRGGSYLYSIGLPSGRQIRCLLPHTTEYSKGAAVEVRLRPGHYMRLFKDQMALAC